jgi:hypothetical protein
MHDAKTGHMEVVYQILRYLKGTLGKVLWFKKNQTWIWRVILTLIGQAIGMIEDLHLDIVYMWEATLSHGGARSRWWWHDLPQKLNIEQ